MSGTRCFGVPSKSKAFGSPRVERIVGDRDLGVEDGLAEPTREEAPFLEQAERTEGVVGEVLQQLGKRVRLEHCAVAARLELGGAARAAGFLGRLACDGRRIDVLRPPRRLLRVARAPLVGGDHEGHRIGHPLLGAETGGGDDCELRFSTGEEPVDREVACRVDRGGRAPRLVVGPELRGGLVVAVDVRELRRCGEAGEVAVCRCALRGVGRAARELRKAFAVGPVRGRDSSAPVSDDAQRDDRVVD